MNNSQHIKQNTKMYSGIDTLYYFCESNENYDDLFLEILDHELFLFGPSELVRVPVCKGIDHISLFNLQCMTGKGLGKV